MGNTRQTSVYKLHQEWRWEAEFFLQKAIGIVASILARRSLQETNLWLRWKWSVYCLMLFVVIEAGNISLACKRACVVPFSRRFIRFGEWIASWFREPVLPVMCSIVSSEACVSEWTGSGWKMFGCRQTSLHGIWMDVRLPYLFIFVVFPKLFSQLKGHVTFPPEAGRKSDSLSVTSMEGMINCWCWWKPLTRENVEIHSFQSQKTDHSDFHFHFDHIDFGIGKHSVA